MVIIKKGEGGESAVLPQRGEARGLYMAFNCFVKSLNFWVELWNGQVG